MIKSKFCFILCIFLIGFSCRKQGDFKKQNITSPVVIAQLTDQMKSNLDDIIQQYNQWVTQINQGLPNLTGLLGTNTALIGQINTIIALNLPPTGVFNVNDLLTESKNILNQVFDTDK